MVKEIDDIEVQPTTLSAGTNDGAAIVDTEASDVVTAAEYGGQAPKKKNKKPFTKKKKIVIGVVSGVISAILIAVIVLVAWFFTRPIQKVPFDLVILDVDMGNSYYVGSEGGYDSALSEGKEVTRVEGAYNVSTYEDFFAKLSEGKDVVVHAKDLAMTKALGAIKITSDIYGNGVKINAHEIVKGTLKEGGTGAMLVETDEKVTIRDIQVMGKIPEEGDNLKTFNNYGILLNVEGTAAKKAKADIIHCIFENGHKVVHFQSAIVYMEGTIVRNASDTAISIATFANQSTYFTSKNNVVADSLTGGILSYCYDNNINASNDNEATWNVINIEGFLDIYNWKKASDLVFIPDTELSPEIAAAINPFLADEIAKPEYADLAVTEGGEKYIHFGIIKIATNGYAQNKTIVKYDGVTLSDDASTNVLSYKLLTFPIPTFGKNFLKQIQVAGYFNNNEGAVTKDSKLSNLPLLYKELREGRADSTATI